MRDRQIGKKLVALILFTGTVSCGSTAAPSPPPTRIRPTSAPTALPSLAPTATTSPTTPLPPPTSTPMVEPISAQPMALFAAGSREQPRLFELTDAGVTTDLQRNVFGRAAVSGDGRWLAAPSDERPANQVVVSNWETYTTYTISVTSGFDLYGMAFDTMPSRLAFLELGPPEGDATRWTIVVVRLDDGSTVRFEAGAGPDEDLLPGAPLGWFGDELLLNTFLPYSEAGSADIWAVALPVDIAAAPLETLDRRRVLSGDEYLFDPEISPDASRALFLNRDYDYTPANYVPIGYDLAVNQLSVLDLTSGSATLLLDVTDGGALAGDVSWSPDGTLGAFAEGQYGNGTFASLILKTVDRSGTVTAVDPLPLPAGGFLVSLDWCAEDEVLVVVANSEGLHELYIMEVTSGDASLIASDDVISVLGCVQLAAAREAGNADVVRVRAVQTAGPEPGEGAGTWTFRITVEHPDTGWEDYADGWDVMTPTGEVLKPDPESPFTRTLLHPHVNEQPFTRSQTDIVIPEGVTQVRVRAHDVVDGYGGKEVVVDLTVSSGPSFEVER